MLSFHLRQDTGILEVCNIFQANWPMLSTMAIHATSGLFLLSSHHWIPSCTNMEWHYLDTGPLSSFRSSVAGSTLSTSKGLADTEKSLKPSIHQLSALRPTSAAGKWIILFVVPNTMMASFVAQCITHSAGASGAKYEHWEKKTTQFVLGLPVEEVLRSHYPRW